MAERLHPVARVRLYEAGREYQMKYDGFGHYDVAADLVESGQGKVSTVAAGALGLWSDQPLGAATPAAMAVQSGDRRTVICRPFLDTTQGVGLGHMRAIVGRWRELRGLGLGGEVKLYQEDGTANAVTGLESRFTLPANPVFAVTLWRAEPGREHDWSHPPYTKVHFGASGQEEWAVIIPYGSPLYVMRRQGGEWQRLSGRGRALRLPTLEGVARGQRALVWIGAVGGRVVASTDGFGQETVAFGDGKGSVRVREGRLSLWHNAGQWCASVFGVRMAPATVWSPAVETGYPTVESAGEVFAQAWATPVTDDGGQVLGTVTVTDDTAERLGLRDTERGYKAVLTPHRHVQTAIGTDPVSGEPVDFATWVSPEWHGAQIGQYAEVALDSGIGWRDVTGDVREISGELATGGVSARHEVVLDNQLGAYADLQEYRRVTLALGWELGDGTTEMEPVCDGVVVEPPLRALAGSGAETEMQVLDGMLRLADEKADMRTPVFDGWPVIEVVRWVLGRCGIPEEQQALEDTGAVLSSGDPEQPAWEVEPGRSWSEFLAQVARFDYNAAMYFDGDGVLHKGCSHCRKERTAEEVAQHTGGLESACGGEVKWELYTRPTVAAEATAEGEVLELHRLRRSLHGEDFANYVAVTGMDVAGRPVRAVAYDEASLYDPESDRFVGWRKMDVWALPGAVGEAGVQRLAAERLAQLGPRPEHAVVVTPLLPAAQIGQVIAVRGGETTGAGGQVYRVKGVRHRVSRLPEQQAVTVIEARWLGSEAE